MIIAMSVMWVVQPAIDEVIDVIAVRHAFMSAVWPMRVRAPGLRRAARRVGLADFDNMFVDMIFMNVMQMTIVEIIDMAMMAHGRVSTVRTMPMSVIRMMLLVAGRHGFARLPWGLSSRRLPYALPIRTSVRTTTFGRTVGVVVGLSSTSVSPERQLPYNVRVLAQRIIQTTWQCNPQDGLRLLRMAREVALAMCILNKDKIAGRNVPDLSVTRLVRDRAVEPHGEHAIRHRVPINLAHTRRNASETDTRCGIMRR
jgi:hypothetical protein